MRIYGNGTVADFENLNDHGRKTAYDHHNPGPFYDEPSFNELAIRKNVTKIIVDEGIHSIEKGVCGDVFFGFSAVQEIVIPESVISTHKETCSYIKELNKKEITIYGIENSYAELFAKENAFSFRVRKCTPLDNGQCLASKGVA